MKYIDIFKTNLIPQSPVTCCTILPTEFDKSLYFLHGYQETHAEILKKSNLEELAEQYKIAIVIPDVPSNYYQNQTWELKVIQGHDFADSTNLAKSHCYTERFLIEELFPAIRSKYNLSTHKENTCISGVSMGGFGSLLIGSHYPNLFGKIASISGAFIIDDLLNGNPQVTGGNQNFNHFYNLFGPIWELEFSDERNPLCAAQTALDQGYLPPIFLSCGRLDMLYERNRKMYSRLTALGADVTWKETPGVHNWDCFNFVLEDVIRWLTD